MLKGYVVKLDEYGRDNMLFWATENVLGIDDNDNGTRVDEPRGSSSESRKMMVAWSQQG